MIPLLLAFSISFQGNARDCAYLAGPEFSPTGDYLSVKRLEVFCDPKTLYRFDGSLLLLDETGRRVRAIDDTSMRRASLLGWVARDRFAIRRRNKPEIFVVDRRGSPLGSFALPADFLDDAGAILAISPDGKYIALAAESAAIAAKVWVLRVSDGAVVRRTRYPNTLLRSDVRWSSDSRTFAYALGSNETGAERIVATELASGRKAVTAWDGPRIQSVVPGPSGSFAIATSEGLYAKRPGAAPRRIAPGSVRLVGIARGRIVYMVNQGFDAKTTVTLTTSAFGGGPPSRIARVRDSDSVAVDGARGRLAYIDENGKLVLSDLWPMVGAGERTTRRISGPGTRAASPAEAESSSR